MSDSNSDDDYILSGNHMAGGGGNNPPMHDFRNNKNDLDIQDLDYGQDDFKQNQDNDLKVEDDWNFEMPDKNVAVPQKTMSKRQELLEAQKNKYTKKKTYIGSSTDQAPVHISRHEKANAPTLDDMYKNEYESKIKKYDQELEGEIQHESLKKNLEEQRYNQRVEFVAEDPAQLLRKAHQNDENEDLGRIERVDMDGAQFNRGQYDDEQKPKKKKKKKKRATEIDETDMTVPAGLDTNGHDYTNNTGLEEHELIPAVQQRKHIELEEELPETDPSAHNLEGEGESNEQKKKKKKKKSKKRQEEHDLEEEKNEFHEEHPPIRQSENEGQMVAPIAFEEERPEEEKPRKSKSKKDKKEAKNKRKEEILKIKNEFMEKLISPFTEVDDLVDMFMKPLPKEVGILECTVARNKSGFNYWNPKYTLILSDGERFLLNGKKRGGNKTSNYLITLDQDKLKKKGKGFLGKLRANFMGTEFIVYDQGENPKKTKNVDEARRELGAVLYESNVLGSKGPRKMRVIIPAIDQEDNIWTWKPTGTKEDSMVDKYKAGKKEMMLVFHNKEPKWNETVQAYVLNFNGRVDQASVKNFQLIMGDENYIFMQFGKVGKNDFNMDVQWPLSIFQAFAISLSSIDKKFGCE